MVTVTIVMGGANVGPVLVVLGFGRGSGGGEEDDAVKLEDAA